MIEVDHIQKKYHHEMVLDISYYHFKRGEYYLIVGHNGSGKSTFMKSILGLIHLNQGKIECRASSIGYVPEKHYPIDGMKIETFLKQLYLLRGCNKKEMNQKIDEACMLWEIPRHKSLQQLSKGMLQKVFLLQATLHQPDLYIFDEPLSGLDDTYQTFFLDKIKKIKEEGKTILITTHYPKYYQNYDKILHMKRGHLYDENDSLPC